MERITEVEENFQHVALGYPHQQQNPTPGVDQQLYVASWHIVEAQKQFHNQDIAMKQLRNSYAQIFNQHQRTLVQNNQMATQILELKLQVEGQKQLIDTKRQTESYVLELLLSLNQDKQELSNPQSEMMESATERYKVAEARLKELGDRTPWEHGRTRSGGISGRGGEVRKSLG